MIGNGADQRVVTDALRRERGRIAADIHDLVLQDLALALGTARMLADGARPDSYESLLAQACERAAAGARRMMQGLLDTEREATLEAIEASVRAAARDVPVSYRAPGVDARSRLDGPTLDALVHIAREAVTNAVKHSRASTVEVVLERERAWRLSVRDDGRGFDGVARRGSFGLASMRRHARDLGGSLTVASAPDGGTTVEAVLP